MIYCLKCGNLIDDGEWSCRKCGARRNCNSEVFDMTKSEKADSDLCEKNGIIERCKRFISKWR